MQTLGLTAALAALGLLAAPAAAADPVMPPVFSNPLASTNPLVPFEVGAYKMYTGKSDGAPIAVIDRYSDVTRSFTAYGQVIECHLIEELEFEDGGTKEISHNWFAEADDGTVYYFGETVDIYAGGEVVSHDGSWLVGGPTEPADPEDTATADVPAVFMPFVPEVGDAWKPEDLLPLVDETVTAQKTGTKAKVPAGKFTDVTLVKETSLLPDSSPELKWYAPGVGVIKTKGKGEKLLLVAATFLSGGDGD